MPLSGELQAIVDRLNRDNARYAEQTRRAHQEAYDVAGALAARLGAADVQIVVAENARAWERIEHGADDRLDWAALGYTIHNIYGVIENYCLRVAKFFENGLEGGGWHRELLHRMTLSIGSLRPALLSADAYVLIDELRSFRHLFRNLYARPHVRAAIRQDCGQHRPLDPDRTRSVQARVAPATAAFRDAHDTFVARLETIAASLVDET
jgi:hypothetical protein